MKFETFRGENIDGVPYVMTGDSPPRRSMRLPHASGLTRNLILSVFVSGVRVFVGAASSGALLEPIWLPDVRV